jgi:hypothetical protein
MPDYEPPEARRINAKAAMLQDQYRNAVAVIQGSAQLSREEKRARLNPLHVQHQTNMNQLRLDRLAAHDAARRQAISEVARDDTSSPSALRADVYQRALEDAMAKDTAELVGSYDLAELIGSDLHMRAAAVAALLRRSPIPGDQASRLVARFADATEPDGHGGQRYRFPKASGAWDRLTQLDAWSDRDHLEAAAAFSVSSVPPRPAPAPPPQSPADAARADVAALYAGSNGTPAPAASSGDQGA